MTTERAKSPGRSATSARTASTASKARRQGRLPQPIGPAARGLATPASHRARRLGNRAECAQRVRRLRSFTGAHATRSTAAATGWPPAGSGRARRRNSELARQVAATLLGSSKKNYLDDDPAEPDARQSPQRSAQLERRFATGGVAHRLIVAGETEREKFHARDTAFGGFHQPGPQRGTQCGDRANGAASTGASRATSQFAATSSIDSGTRPACARRCWPRSGGFSLAGSYAEGIAQPTFFDLYGFFPRNFVGNPELKPESSRGFEVSLRYRAGRSRQPH